MTLKSEIDQLTEKSEELRLENATLMVSAVASLQLFLFLDLRLFNIFAEAWKLWVSKPKSFVVIYKVVHYTGETEKCTRARDYFEQCWRQESHTY